MTLVRSPFSGEVIYITPAAGLPPWGMPSPVGQLEEDLDVIQRTTRERVAMVEEQEQKIEEPVLQVCRSPI